MAESEHAWRTRFLRPKRVGFPESCDHTLHPTDQHGEPTGSWFNTASGDRIRVACYYCNKLYGYIAPPEEREENKHRAKQRKRLRRHQQI